MLQLFSSDLLVRGLTNDGDVASVLLSVPANTVFGSFSEMVSMRVSMVSSESTPSASMATLPRQGTTPTSGWMISGLSRSPTMKIKISLSLTIKQANAFHYLIGFLVEVQAKLKWYRGQQDH